MFNWSTTTAGVDGILGNADDVTTTLMGPLIQVITDNLDVLLPVGLGIMAIMVGVSLIPRIVYKFL